MRCEDVREELVAWLDEELSAEQRAAVEGHLAGCPSCQEELVGLQRAFGLLAALPTAEPSAGFARGFWQRFEREPRRTSWLGSLRLRGVALVAASLCLCAVVVGALWFGRFAERGLSREEQEIASRIDLFQDYEAIAELDLLEDLDVIEALPDLK